MMRQHVDIAIVGGGLAGLALATALGGSGLRVAVIEGRPLQLAWPPVGTADGVADFDLRVSAVTPASQQWLARLGAWRPEVAGRAQPYRHMHVWEHDGTGAIDFDAAEVNAASLGHIVENRVLLAGLLHALEPHHNVQVLSPATVGGFARMDDQVELRLMDGRLLRARLVVGADGAASPVREWAAIPCRRWEYDQRALVATIATAQPHAATAWQIFHRSGPLALLPLPGSDGTHYSSIVWSSDTAEAEELAALDDAAFIAALERASEQRLGRVLAIGQRAHFPLRAQHATAYTAPHVALIGDAAHTIHPLAGQGINLGFSDARALADELLRAHRRGLRADDPGLLARFQRRRKGDNLAMLAAMEGFKRLFGAEALPLRLLRNRGLALVNRLGPAKRTLIRQAMGTHEAG